MSRNFGQAGDADASSPTPSRFARPGERARGVVLVGLMGSGKTAVGRRLAGRLNLPFRDADVEIERAAGMTIAELFERWGEPAFRDGERRVIQRLLNARPSVIATGGGAWLDPQTRALARRLAVSVWLRVPLPILLERVRGREHRPLLRDGDPEATLRRLAAARDPVYGEADLIVDGGDDGTDAMMERVAAALDGWMPPARVDVGLGPRAYDVTIGEGLTGRAGVYLAPVLAPGRRCVIVTDHAVAALHLDALREGLARTAIASETVAVAPGEASKSLESYAALCERILALGIDRRTAIVALGGGVVGDLAGFAAATLLRGLPFVQVPTTLLAQVDSSVGGKTGINAAAGKNLIGAFHQPRAVLADIDALATLPARELRAGYAEIVKAGLIGHADLFGWCEANGAALIAGDVALRTEAVRRACAFKAAVVARDEREESGGRALLNLGHTFGHALEAACGYDGSLLHGEAVALGLVLAFRLSERLGHCPPELAERVAAHLRAVGLPAELRELGRDVSAEALIATMRRDKKAYDGALTFVLARGIGMAFLDSTVPAETVRALLRDEGCLP